MYINVVRNCHLYSLHSMCFYNIYQKMSLDPIDFINLCSFAAMPFLSDWVSILPKNVP